MDHYDVDAPTGMAAHIKAKDWAATSLGPPATWSPTLTWAVQMILASGFPMAVRWGPEFIMIYNDGYRAILGDKHPWALGLPFATAWPEVQSDLRPLHDAILSGASKAFFAEDFLLRIQRRNAQWEDARFTISYSPLPDDTAPNGVGGVLITVVETTQRVAAETALAASAHALRESDANLRLILDSATDAIYCVDRAGNTTRANAAFLKMLGFSSEDDVLGHKLHDVIHHSHADGSPYPKEECPIYLSARDGSTAHVDTEFFYRKDGTRFPVEYWVSPILRDGVQIGAVCTFIDITERRRAQEQQAMLVGELNHRVKNLFTVASSMITLSAKSAKSVPELTKAIRGRLEALAAAHELILPHGGDTKLTSTSLTVLIRKVLSPYDLVDPNETSSRICLDGPDESIGPTAATSLALVLHELSTNSAKYGALSSAGGSLALRWKTVDETFSLVWEERGGPPVAGPPSSKGFGTLLATHSVQGDFSGELKYSWNSDGLVVDLAFPEERLVR